MIESVNALALLMGGSWASGINLYMTAAVLGVAHRLQWIALPGDLGILSHPLVISVAILLYAIEFFADKVPYIDSAWDSVHTFIRPAGGLALGYLAMADANPAVQYAVGLLTGTVALDSHLTKATSRVAINTSPEPVTNTVASVTEDVGVLGAIYLIIHHPIVICVLVVLFIIFSVWFLRKMFDFLKSVLRREKKLPEESRPPEKFPEQQSGPSKPSD